MKTEMEKVDLRRRLNSSYLALKKLPKETDDFDDMFCLPLMNTNGRSKTLKESRELQKKCSLYQSHESGWCKFCMSVREFDGEEVWSDICKNDFAKDKAAIIKALEDI